MLTPLKLLGVGTVSSPTSTEICGIHSSIQEPSIILSYSQYVIILLLSWTPLIIGQYFLDALIAIAGFLMFGQKVRDEVTSNIITNRGYPHSISVCIVVFIAIIPLTKIPLK